MIAFGKQVQVHFPQQQLAEAVGIFGDLLTAGPLDFQQVGLASAEVPNKQAWHLGGIEAAKRLTCVTRQYLDTQGLGQERTDKLAALLVIMGPQDRKRIGVLGAHQRIDVLGRRQCSQLGLQRFSLCKTHDVSPPRTGLDIGVSPLSKPCSPCRGTGSQLGRFSAS